MAAGPIISRSIAMTDHSVEEAEEWFDEHVSDVSDIDNVDDMHV